MLQLLDYVRSLLSSVNSILALSFIFLLGMYVFWRGSVETRKNRSSVFDMFLISGLFSVIVGRIMYIVLEWDKFSSYIWYWLPYEKYGNTVFLFRLLPWRFFSIWDGGLVIFSMFLSILVFMTFYSFVIKKWNWSDMFLPVYFSATTMLSLSFVLTGFVGGFNDWIYKGLILLLFIGIFLVLYKFIYSVVKNSVDKKHVFGYIGTIVVWISSIYISYIYFADELSVIEDIEVILFDLWSLISGLLFIRDIQKPNVTIKTVSSVRSVRV